jgi:hypothetical protein
MQWQDSMKEGDVLEEQGHFQRSTHHRSLLGEQVVVDASRQDN